MARRAYSDMQTKFQTTPATMAGEPKTLAVLAMLAMLLFDRA
jgi:hypothetical protein